MIGREGDVGLLSPANDDHDSDAVHSVAVALAARRLTDCVAVATALKEGDDHAELAATLPWTTLRRTPISHVASPARIPGRPKIDLVRRSVQTSLS